MKRFSLTSMKRVFIFVLLISFGSIILNAQPISEDVARKKAASFFLDNKKGIKAAKGKEDHSALEDSLKLIEGDDAYYIFNLESKGGYVIVSGDDRMPAVLGYSMDGCFKEENMPDNLRAWLDGYKEQYQYLQTHEDAITVSETTTASESRTKIYPLLTTCWGQDAPYNEQCPQINGERTVTGCVATAMAQIMNYHQWPKQTSKTIEGYILRNSNITINVPTIEITTIDWNNMLDIYSENFFDTDSEIVTQENKDAVSTLMNICGTAVLMNYGTDGSAASLDDAKFAFTEYFDYNKSTIDYLKRNQFNNNEEWVQLIYNEVKSKRPVLYGGNSEDCGGAHAFVIDGYDKDDYFHVNWGWDGSADGYFLLTSLNGFVYNQDAVVGIQGKGNTQHKYAYAELKDNVITFYYDNKREQRQGELDFLNGKLFNGKSEEVTSVTFNSSFSKFNKIYSTAGWFSNMTNLKAINHLEYLDTSNVIDMTWMFLGCQNLTSLDVSKFNTSKVKYMISMFYDCQNLTSLDVSNFNTSNVTDMGNMFGNCQNLTSLDVSKFNTQNVICMEEMFYDCQNLTSLDVSNFNTSNVTDMNGMFGNCKKLTSLDLSKFKTSKVTKMQGMFYDCQNLTSLNVSKFNTQNVTDMSYMFYDCWNLTSLDVSNFNTSKVTNMKCMFYGCQNITSLDVSNFNTSNVTNMYSIFYGCQNITSLDVSNFNTSNVTDMSCMFSGCYKLTSLDVSKFKTSKVLYMSAMFASCYNLTSLDISNFNVSKVESINSMFIGCDKLTTIYCAAGTDWSGINDSYGMFFGCKNLKGYCIDRTTCYLDTNKTDGTLARVCTSAQDGYFTLKGTEVKTAKVLWDSAKKTLVFFYDGKTYEQGSKFVCDGTSYTAEWIKEWKPKNYYHLWGIISDATTAVFDKSFQDFRPTSCKNLFLKFENLENIINLKNLNTSEVTDMSAMFYSCSKLTSLDVSKFNTSKVTDMSSMFSSCNKLTSLDVSSFITSNVTKMSYMFAWCNNLAVIYCNEGTNWSGVKESSYMFSGCSKLRGYCKGRTTNYSSDKTDATLACICTSSQDGYFTDIKMKDTNPVIQGDANSDGEVNVTDIVEIVNYIMEKPSDKFVFAAADVNEDSEINVTDIVKVVSIIMSTNNARAFGTVGSDESTIYDCLQLMTNDDHTLSLNLENETGYVASQFDLVLSDGQTLEAIALNNKRSNGHALTYSQTGTNTYRVVIYSLENQRYSDNNGELLNIAVSGSGAVTVENILFVTQDQEEKRFTPISSQTTGINVIEQSEDLFNGDWYDLQGRKIVNPSRGHIPTGIYIFNGKKRVIK